MTSNEHPKSVVLAVTHEVSAVTFYRGYLAHLRNKGWEVTVVASSESGDLLEFARSEGVKSISLPMRREPSPLKDLCSLVRWLTVLNDVSPTVVVAATPKASLLALTAAFLNRVPVRVYQLWGLRLETETGVRRLILKALEKVTIMSATKVVANSLSLVSAAGREGILRRRGAEVVGAGSSHGVDLERFSRDADIPDLPGPTQAFLREHGGSTVVGFIGRLHNDKGLDTLLEALESLSEHSSAKIACIVVGGTENPDLQRRIAEKSAALDIHMAGQAKDPRPFIMTFDMICLPSRREGFPNVILEAAAMGVPAVVSDATGVVDSVVSDVTGLVFRTGQAEELAEAIESLAVDPARLANLGRAARDRAVKEFDNVLIWDLQEEALAVELGRIRGDTFG